MANYKLIEFKFEEEHTWYIISENSIYQLTRYGLVGLCTISTVNFKCMFTKEVSKLKLLLIQVKAISRRTAFYGYL